MSKKLSVRSSKYTYNVRFEEDFSQTLSEHIEKGDFVTVDANVFKLYEEKLAPLLKTVRYFEIEPLETNKSYQGIGHFIDYLLENGFRKNNRLIAVGGGITQDITAFVASILFRGVEWVFYPTTLLAQCDSCIGSKTSINFGKYKNQLGGFYPPKEIVIDLRFLDTLSALDLRSGMGEMLHYYLVSGEEDFERIFRQYDSAFQDKKVLEALIYHSLDFKRSYVERDEFDQGPRNVFNYGHSFGHAIESLTNYAVPHGIAVSIGMDLANFISVKFGYISSGMRERMRQLLRKNWGDTCLKGIKLSEFINTLKKDKKAVGTEVNVILTKGLGQMFKSPLPMTQEVVEWMAQYFEEFNSAVWELEYSQK